MGEQIKVKADLSRLDKFIKTLATANNLGVKVGILAKKSSRKGGADSNASIGVKHEFGSYTKNIPERSFIRMPLEQKSDEIIREVNRLAWDVILTSGNITPLLKKAGVAAEGVIGKAFKTGGFGQWAPIKPATEARKKSDKILIETSQLQRSIMSAVVKRGKG